MSAPVCILLDPTAIGVVTRGIGTVRELTWSPAAPEAMIDSLRALVGAPSAVVIVVGLGLLEIASPELPPMPPDARRVILWRDADRYFPINEPVAVVSADALALATPARLLSGWVRAISALGPVRAIVTTPQLCARLTPNGECTVPAGVGEVGAVHVRDGALQSVRRLQSGVSGHAVGSAKPVAATPSLLGREAFRWANAPLDAQLLDAVLAEGLQRARARRWLSSVVLAAASIVMLLWSLDRWRDSQLSALEAELTRLAQLATPAMRAEARQARAQAEVRLLTSADRARHAPDAPLTVLSALTRVLPRDAFVQRLEWDGAGWRVEGTADNARRLVPLLDSDAFFRDVRIAAASQRFLDAGRRRESFAISFRVRGGDGGTDGAR